MGLVFYFWIATLFLLFEGFQGLTIKATPFQLYYQGFAGNNGLASAIGAWMGSLNHDKLTTRQTLVRLLFGQSDYNFHGLWRRQRIVSGEDAHRLLQYYWTDNNQQLLTQLLPTDLILRNSFLATALQDRLDKYRPNVIIFPSELENQDYNNLGDAVREILRLLLAQLQTSPARCGNVFTMKMACQLNCEWACYYLGLNRPEDAFEIYQSCDRCHSSNHNTIYPTDQRQAEQHGKRCHCQYCSLFWNVSPNNNGAIRALWHGKLLLMMRKQQIDNFHYLREFIHYLKTYFMNDIPPLVVEQVLQSFHSHNDLLADNPLHEELKEILPKLQIIDRWFPTLPAPWDDLSLRLYKWRNSQTFGLDDQVPQGNISLDGLLRWWTFYENLTTVMILPQVINITVKMGGQLIFHITSPIKLLFFFQKWYLESGIACSLCLIESDALKIPHPSLRKSSKHQLLPSNNCLYYHCKPQLWTRTNEIEDMAKGLARYMAMNLFYLGGIGFRHCYPNSTSTFKRLVQDMTLWKLIRRGLEMVKVTKFVSLKRLFTHSTETGMLNFTRIATSLKAARNSIMTIFFFVATILILYLSLFHS